MPTQNAAMPLPFPLQRGLGKDVFSIEIATQADIIPVQKLRYQIFKHELGYSLTENEFQLDQDPYDQHCDHLIIRDTQKNQIIATYRLLRRDVAKANIGFYSELEFDLSCLYQLPFNFCEIGRACIDAKYREQNIIALLWTGVAEYCRYYNIDYLGGCTTTGKDVNQAIAFYHYAKHIDALCDEATFPITAQPNNQVAGFTTQVPDYPLDFNAIKRDLPPLMRAYYSIGGTLCAQPAYDPDFDVIDFFTLLHVNQNARRIMRFFGT